MPKASEFPEEGELVVCTVQNVKNFGAFVTLDEYGNKEGFIHVRDVATGWVKYIRDYVREGQKIVCKVLGVDSSKGHIDLSLKSVNEHQRREKIQQWKNENKAEKLMEIVAERLGTTVEATLESFGYDLADKFGTLYAAFEACAASATALEEAEVVGRLDHGLRRSGKGECHPTIRADIRLFGAEMSHRRWCGQDQGSAPGRNGSRRGPDQDAVHRCAEIPHRTHRSRL